MAVIDLANYKQNVLVYIMQVTLKLQAKTLNKCAIILEKELNAYSG